MLAHLSRSAAALGAALVLAACASDGPSAPNLDATLPALTSASLNNGPFSGVLPSGAIVTANDARDRALLIFPGATITDVDLLDLERELAVAEVRLLPAGGGGEVKLHFSLDNGMLAEAEGEVSPFTYTFAPGGDFASLATAMANATGANGKAGTVTEWKLQLEENARWQYRVWLSATDGEWRVRVDARTAAVNRIQDR